MRRASLEWGERVLPVDLGYAQREGRVCERRVVPVDEDRADPLGQIGRHALRVGVEPRVRGGHHATARVLNDRGHCGLAQRGGRGRGRRVHDAHTHGRQVGRKEG